MSISAGYGSGGPLSWFGWFTRLFGSRKDERSPAILKTLHIIAKVLEEIEITRRRMEDRYNDLAKKAKEAALKGDRDHHKILLIEMDEVGKLIALMEHAKKSVYQIQLRLETMLEMGNTFDQLPEIMNVISNLKPMLAKVTPELMEKMAELEKEVSSIMASTTIPPIYGKVKPKNVDVGTDAAEELRDLLPPQNTPTPQIIGYGGSWYKQESTRNTTKNNVGIDVVKKWLLDEIMLTNGFLDIEAFIRKYGVDKTTVLKALNKLYEEGKIVFKK